MPGQLEAIVFLQKTLTELADADRRLNTIPDWMSELHEEHNSRKGEIDTVEAEGATADQERREAEAALADAQEKQKHYQEQLGQVSTQREYGALLKEIDTTKNQISSSEQAALEATERKEQADEQISELRQAFKDLDTRYNVELKKWEREKPAVAKAAKELTARSQELRTQVQRQNRVLFDRLFERGSGVALARVLKMKVAKGNAMFHCETCSYNVRPQVVVEIRDRDTLNQCDSCKRILYWEDED